MNQMGFLPYLAAMKFVFTSLVLLIGLVSGGCHLRAADWAQDGGNAQRTGYTTEEPLMPWKSAWSWNGPDAKGGSGNHRYHQPAPHEPWEARVCAGGGYVFAPAGAQGLYALKTTDGSVAWQFKGGTCHATPALDASNGLVYVGTQEGTLHQLEVASGRERAVHHVGAPLTKSLLLVPGRVIALTAKGGLHCMETRTLRLMWTYEAGSPAAALPAYSASRDSVIFVTEDLTVHSVNMGKSAGRWKVKPTTLTPQDGVEFTGGWPVVAERHGIVFVRLVHRNCDATIWSGGGPKGRWPTTNEAIRQRLLEQPRYKNLFALSLDDGKEVFVPNVGPAGVEDMEGDKPRLRAHCFPVIKEVDGHEVAYIAWRNGDTQDATWDARWDSHLGEMVLDDETVPGLEAGDLRFVQSTEHGGWMRITDESCPLTMAGSVIFHSHWDACTAVQITDRTTALGLARALPIKTTWLPPVARHIKLAPAAVDTATHWTRGNLQLMDGRSLPGPGWWVYANELDPPTPARSAYSEGILPRYAIVAGGLVIIQGNGGELFVLRHAGKQETP